MRWRTRSCFVGIVATLALALAVATMIRGGQPPSSLALGKQIAKLDLKDVAGKTWTVSDLKGHKAVVVVFLGTECPVNNAYMPRLAELHKNLRRQGRPVPGHQQQQARHPWPNRGPRQGIRHPLPRASRTAIRSPPTSSAPAALPRPLSSTASCKFVYQGRIDDQFGVGFQRAKAERDDLADALDEVLAGKPVARRHRRDVAGCLIGRAPTVAAAEGTRHLRQARRPDHAKSLPGMPSRRPDRADAAPDATTTCSAGRR